MTTVMALVALTVNGLWLCDTPTAQRSYGNYRPCRARKMRCQLTPSWPSSRFVNGFADAGQTGARARSVNGIAQGLNIPSTAGCLTSMLA